MSKKIILLSFLLLFSLSISKLEDNLIQLPMNVSCINLEDPMNDGFLFGKDESGFSFNTEYFDTQIYLTHKK